LIEHRTDTRATIQRCFHVFQHLQPIADDIIATNANGILVLPTGGGKTFTAVRTLI
jgi:Lhr-like helicase